MKKFYTLIIIALISLPLIGQNLVLNGNLEQWDDDTHPTGWNKMENIEKETTIVHNGSFSAKHTGGTKDFGQYIDVTPGVSYTISLWYYSIYADGEDCRIWSYWKDGDGASLDDNADELRGPDNNYLPGDGEWKQYTTTLTAPALAAQLYLEVRTYSGSITYWDDFSVTSAADNTPPVWTDGYPFLTPHYDIGGDLYVNMDEPGTVYYIVLGDGSASPTAEEVKAGLDYGTTSILKAGSFDIAEANSTVMHFIDGASPLTPYDIYVVAEDLEGNLQSSPEKFDITTGSARTITITSPLEYETYFVGEEVTLEWTATSNISQVEIVGYDYRQEELFVLAADDQGYPLYLDASLGEYTYTIPLDAATDSVAIIIRNAQEYIVCDTVTPVYLDDIIPPDIVEVWPANQSTGQSLYIQISLVFNEEIFPGNGSFYVRNEDGSLFEEMDIAGEGDSQPLDIVANGYQININPTSDYQLGNTYYLEMDEGVLVDYFDNQVAAISGNLTLSFTIIEGSDATLSDLLVSGTTVDGFDPGTYTYTYTLDAGETVVPTVTAISTDPNADLTIDPAINLDGTQAERTATVTVVADDESATLNYTITFELATSITRELDDAIKIYPVPVTSTLMLENISTIDYLEVLDITGSRVYEEVTGGETSHRINISHLPEGIYFLRLSDGKNQITRKFIKQ